jgi:hypothetical protein
MLLFVLASGLSVTLGLMNFINLAHGTFAMIGGYVTALLALHFSPPCLRRSPSPQFSASYSNARFIGDFRCKPARSGPNYDRPCADGDADRRLSHRRRAATGSFADLA